MQSWKDLLEASKMDLIMHSSEHLLKLLSVRNFHCLQEGKKDIQQLHHAGCTATAAESSKKCTNVQI